jgi:hypothetical protein
MKPLTLLTLTAMVAASTVFAQVLTTGGTAGSSINAGANIGAGNHTGASINADEPEAAQIRGKLGVSGQAVARENTTGQTGTDNPANVPAMSGATGSQNGIAVHATTRVHQEIGTTTVQELLPLGAASYTYYPEAQVYLSPGTKTYYYTQQGRWYSSTSLPAGVTLGNSRTLQMSGSAKVK